MHTPIKYDYLIGNTPLSSPHIPTLIPTFMCQAHPEKPLHQLLKMQWKQREHITLSTDSLVGSDAKQHQKNSTHKSPDAQEMSQNQRNHPQEFNGIPKLITCLGIVCQDHKGHI